MKADPPTSDAPLEHWLDWISAQHPQSIALGLDRVRRVGGALNLPSRPAPLTLIIAGTNGKGSSLAYLRAILGSAGLKVASYLSPHLLDFRERLQLGGDYASAAAWSATLSEVEAARGDTTLTYFEATTLAALLLISRSDVDAAVLEVGLGGRLDAVNLVDADAALITTVDLDHQAFLGPDRETIGIEKAGVLRAGMNAVYSEIDAVASVPRCASALGARLMRAGRDYRFQLDAAAWSLDWTDGRRLRLPLPNLPGAQQLQNAAGCIVLLEMLADRWPRSEAAYAEGLRRARMPGRMQVISDDPPITVDVAHNPQAARALAAALANEAGAKVAVFGLLDDKDLDAIIAPLLPLIRHWHCVGLERVSPRGHRAETLADALRAAGADATAHPDLARGLAAACAAAGRDARVIAFGSFLTVAGVLRARGMTELPPLP